MAATQQRNAIPNTRNACRRTTTLEVFLAYNLRKPGEPKRNPWPQGVGMSSDIIRLRVLLSFLLVASGAWAQKTTGDLKGTVFDPGNAVVPKAVVTAKDTATGLSFETVSGGDGA